MSVKNNYCFCLKLKNKLIKKDKNKNMIIFIKKKLLKFDCCISKNILIKGKNTLFLDYLYLSIRLSIRLISYKKIYLVKIIFYFL